MTHKTLTALHCQMLGERLANGLHVADIDVHRLLATVMMLRDEVGAQFERAELLRLSLREVRAVNARYREALRVIASDMSIEPSSYVATIARDALADSTTPGEGT